jgi:hypothetical protein
MASQERFELPTHGLEGRCSILLSYWDNDQQNYYNTIRKVHSSYTQTRIKALITTSDTNPGNPRKPDKAAVIGLIGMVKS